MYLGTLCEMGETQKIYDAPMHPYTRFLIDAIPKPNPHARAEKRMLLSDDVPSPIDLPDGCRFHTRCPYACDRCKKEMPALRPVDGRLVACHRAGEL